MRFVIKFLAFTVHVVVNADGLENSGLQPEVPLWTNSAVHAPRREGRLRGMDRDRGTPHGATPPTPPGIRVAYHGGSTGLSWDRDMESGETE